MRPQHAGILSTPGSIRFQIFQHAAIGVVHAAMEHDFGGAHFQLGERQLAQQSHWIVVELVPSRRIQIEEETRGVVVPTPPQIARQCPQPLL